MPILSYDEIRDWSHFEELTEAYFKFLKGMPGLNISNVATYPSGVGIDGGRDILVDILISDGIKEFTRRWIIQCKFHANNISPSDISSINIPSLIHSYKATGYLLICRERPTSGLTTLLERLSEDCQFGYQYIVWSGEQFLSKLYAADDLLHKQFFPVYFKETTFIEKEKNI